MTLFLCLASKALVFCVVCDHRTDLWTRIALLYSREGLVKVRLCQSLIRQHFHKNGVYLFHLSFRNNRKISSTQSKVSLSFLFFVKMLPDTCTSSTLVLVVVFVVVDISILAMVSIRWPSHYSKYNGNKQNWTLSWKFNK